MYDRKCRWGSRGLKLLRGKYIVWFPSGWDRKCLIAVRGCAMGSGKQVWKRTMEAGKMNGMKEGEEQYVIPRVSINFLTLLASIAWCKKKTKQKISREYKYSEFNLTSTNTQIFFEYYYKKFQNINNYI